MMLTLSARFSLYAAAAFCSQILCIFISSVVTSVSPFFGACRLSLQPFTSTPLPSHTVYIFPGFPERTSSQVASSPTTPCPSAPENPITFENSSFPGQYLILDSSTFTPAKPQESILSPVSLETLFLIFSIEVTFSTFLRIFDSSIESSVLSVLITASSSVI